VHEGHSFGCCCFGVGDVEFVKLGDVAVVWGDDDGVKGEFEGGSKAEFGDVHFPAVVEMEVSPVPSW